VTGTTPSSASRGDGADLDALATFGTPTIANALEILGMVPTEGFTDGSLQRMVGSRPFVGWALTATMVSAEPRGDDEAFVATEAYWAYVAGGRPPSVVVVQDLDPHPLGAMYGEVQGRLHRALDVAGIITSGAVRDIPELAAIGLPVIGHHQCVSHAYARFRDLDVEVTVGGLRIRPGDLLHADGHGVQRIPDSIDLGLLARTARDVEAREAELFAAADSRQGIGAFLTTWSDVRSRWPTGEQGEPGSI
jgi:4-hydroxy-4-methyl-2-oxoglutarate aldolase